MIYFVQRCCGRSPSRWTRRSPRPPLPLSTSPSLCSWGGGDGSGGGHVSALLRVGRLTFSIIFCEVTYCDQYSGCMAHLPGSGIPYTGSADHGVLVAPHFPTPRWIGLGLLPSFAKPLDRFSRNLDKILPRPKRTCPRRLTLAQPGVVEKGSTAVQVWWAQRA